MDTWITGSLMSALLAVVGWLWKSVHSRIDDLKEQQEKALNMMDTKHGSAIERGFDQTQQALSMANSAHSRMQDVVTSIQINYVHKNEMREMRKELIDKLDRIEDYLKKV